MLEIAEEK